MLNCSFKSCYLFSSLFKPDKAVISKFSELHHMCDIFSFCSFNCASLVSGSFFFFFSTEITIVLKMNVEKRLGLITKCIWQNFQFVNLTALRWKVWDASYNRVRLIAEKLR